MTTLIDKYKANKKQKVGASLQCPICSSVFRKVQYSQAFCCSTCKDTYHNRTKGDRHRPNYYDYYNAQHPHRLKRIERYYEELYERQDDSEAWCENPILGK